MLKRIEADEVYPAYMFSSVGFPLELTESEVAQVEAAWDAWDEAQHMLRQRLDEQGAYDKRGMMTDGWRGA